MSKKNVNPEQTAARKWAKAQGIHVGQRGLVPTSVLDRYRAAEKAANLAVFTQEAK